MQTNTANSNPQGAKNSKFIAPGSKYSSSLYMKPKASFDLIKPETTNKPPTNTLDSHVNPSRTFIVVSTYALFN